jgi:hypothetical protein
MVERVRKLAEAEGDADFFTADGGRIRRERGIKFTPVMIGTSLDGHFEQPINNAVARPGGLRDSLQQSGYVRNIAQLAGERRVDWLFPQFHWRYRITVQTI